MIQNMSDFLSFVLLLLIPASFLFAFMAMNLKARKKKIENSDEKYYREW